MAAWDLPAACARLALAAVHRPHPYQLVHVVTDDRPRRPIDLHPVFWGAFDWHSAVHAHWTLAAFARRHPTHPVAGDATRALAVSFDSDGLAGELAYLEAHPLFERPYGLAWFLELHRELAAWPEAAGWAYAAGPIAVLAAERVTGWLARLAHPIRVGTHAQSAFAAALTLDWARRNDRQLAARLTDQVVRLHGDDVGPALHLEPSGEDFLSPALGAAAVMSRVLAPPALAGWLDRAIPELETAKIEPPTASDREDGRLVHQEGLAASRAWMLAELAAALPAGDRRQPCLRRLAATHRAAAAAALTTPSYAGAHWLGTFVLRAELVCG
ncbi:MAG: DUF2891 family protein [Kofleriaceae bacterium]